MGILLALATFVDSLHGQKVVAYSDNKGALFVQTVPLALHWSRRVRVWSGAEGCTRKGRAKAFDHNTLIHEIWELAFQRRIQLWIERVPTKDNISDLPSRGQFAFLDALGAQWCHPRWHCLR